MQIDRSLPYSGSRILYDIFQDLWQRTDSLLWRDGWWPQHCKADCKRREVTGLSDQIIRVFLVFFLPFASQKHLLMPADFLLNVCRWRVECIGTFNYIDWNMSIFHPAHLGVSQWKKLPSDLFQRPTWTSCIQSLALFPPRLVFLIIIWLLIRRCVRRAHICSWKPFFVCVCVCASNFSYARETTVSL